MRSGAGAGGGGGGAGAAAAGAPGGPSRTAPSSRPAEPRRAARRLRGAGQWCAGRPLRGTWGKVPKLAAGPRWDPPTPPAPLSPRWLRGGAGQGRWRCGAAASWGAGCAEPPAPGAPAARWHRGAARQSRVCRRRRLAGSGALLARTSARAPAAGGPLRLARSAGGVGEEGCGRSPARPGLLAAGGSSEPQAGSGRRAQPRRAVGPGRAGTAGTKQYRVGCVFL